MQEIILTDPFTGIDFTAVKYDDHTIIAIHPLTGETIRMRYNAQTHAFMLPAEQFTKLETVTFAEAARELGVTRSRISAAVKNGRIPFKKLPNGSKMILKRDLMNYNETKATGRPRKDA